MKRLLLKAFLITTLTSTCLAQTHISERQAYQEEMGSLTAKETWWYFHQRLNDPLEGYHYFRVYLTFDSVWLTDVKQLANGKYEGMVDTDLPHPKVYSTSEKIKFDSLEIGDWFFVDDYRLIGGFWLRQRKMTEQRLFMKKGKFRLEPQFINEDFIIQSKITSNDKNIEVDSLLALRFPGGSTALSNFLQQNLSYPFFARKIGLQGSVTAKFIVTNDGYVENVEIIRGVGGGTNEEVKRIVKLLPNWNPIEDSYSTTFILPVKFLLN